MIKFLIFVSCLVSPVVLYTYETVPLTKDAVGAGNPFWDVETQDLLFVDFEGTLIFRYSWSRNTTDMFTVDGITEPTYIVPVKGSPDQYLISAGGTLYVVNWNGSSDHGHIERELFTISSDVQMDSFYTTAHGELFTGAIAENHCRGQAIHGFYRYTPENGLEEIATNYVASTGIEMINNTVYHLDGCKGILTAFDMDPVTRALDMLRPERTVIELPSGPLYAGLVADQDGFLLSCNAGSKSLFKIDPRIPGIVDEIPTTTRTQLASFGGPGMKTLFVTPGNLTADTRMQQAPAGDLLLIGGLSAPGVPASRAVV